ncbi:MAG: amidohydrolase [Anaerolineales bacterium]
MPNLLPEAQALFPYTQILRRDFHMHPELGFQERRTSGIIAHELRELGLEVVNGVAQTGVVALIEGSAPGPVLMLRFDIDALPINEQTNAEYASQTPGVMHACGHDGHAAIGLTVAKLLHAHRADFAGTVKLVFQPAEEGMGGAEAMIKDGVLQDPRPAKVLGLHIWNEKPLGWLGIAAGPVMAGAGAFKLTVSGRGGHGAIPQQTLDPVVASAQIISAAQSIVARNIDPQQAAVITFATIHGGEAFNVIPAQVEMRGTIRYFEPEVGKTLARRLEEVARAVAEGLGCSAELEMNDLTPPVINDEQSARGVLRAAEKLFPAESVDTRGHFTMGAEDFAFYQQQIPGTYFFVGSTNSARGLVYGHHHPKFDFDEAVLPRAAALMAQAALEVLNIP